MTTTAGAIAVQVEATTATFETSMDRAAASAERSYQRQQRAQASAQRDNDKFIQSIQRQVDSFGLTGTALARYEASLRGVSAQADPLIDRLERMKDAQAAFNAQVANAGASASGIAKGMGDAAGASERATHGTAGLTRELLVLGHEASQGNYKRFGGSLLVLGEILAGAGAATAIFLGSVVALAAPFLALGAAALAGANETKKLRDSLQVTGNAAGVTAGQVDAMSRSLAASAGVGIGKARTALEELIKTGEVGPQNLAAMTTAVVRLEKLTGESSETIVRDFSKMGDGVAKWAAEHNKQFNFISGDQYAYIKRLEEQGLKEQAEAQVLALLNEHLKDLKPNLGYLESAWKSLGETASKAWDSMKGIGRAETVEDRIAKTGAALADMDAKVRARRNLPAFSSAPEGQGNDTRGNLLQQQELNFRDQLRKSDIALGQAEVDRQHKAQIAAIDARDRWRDETKGVSLVNKELEKYRTLTVEPLKGTANAISADEQAATEAAIRKKYDTRGAGQLDNRFKERLEQLTAEGIRLDAEIKSYETYGKAVDKARLAVLNLEIAQGKLQGLSPEKIAQLRAVASADDAKDKLLAETEARVKAATAADKFVQKLTEEANAHAMNAREQDMATKLAELDRIGVQKNTAAYALYVDAIEKAVNAKHDDLLIAKLKAQQLAADDEVAKINEQIAALRMSTLERQNATIALKIQKQAERDILADPAGEIAIRAAAIKQTDELTAANTRLYAAMRAGRAGSDQFFQKYEEEATNAAKITETLVGQGVKHLEDGLTALLSGQKVNFHSMVDAIVAEIIRLQVVKPLLASIFGSTGSNGSGGSLVGWIGGLMGSGGGGSDAAVAGGAALAADGFTGFAVGTNYVPYDNYPAMLHKGEAVVPAAYNPAAGGKGGSAQQITIHVAQPQGMSRQASAQVGADIARQLAIANRRNN